LHRGDQITYAEKDQSNLSVERVDPQVATGWIDGRFEFDHVTLRSAVEILNRYAKRPIHTDGFAGDQVVAGLVMRDQLEQWIWQLPNLYAVDVTTDEHGLCIHSRIKLSHPACDIDN